ncbi:rhodanese-like domain-containing protein [Brachyspira sp.]|uniref:rhodanese-like domain-containing protein n=1 Tax=Brachyspira sp. TaxID=1977261 RepID=UPI002601FCEA|nr:rhodanese-like domain-containing protein [Brachyspira sp.]
MLKSVNVQEATNLIKSNDDIQLLDIRSMMEVNMTGAIEGSILIDLNEPNSEKLVHSLDKNKRYLLYCVTGTRSGALATYMEKHGFNELYNLDYAGHSQLAMALKNN